jgi:hypothetical protein
MRPEPWRERAAKVICKRFGVALDREIQLQGDALQVGRAAEPVRLNLVLDEPLSYASHGGGYALALAADLGRMKQCAYPCRGSEGRRVRGL